MKIVIDKRIPGLQEGILAVRPDYEVVALEGSKIEASDIYDADALIVRTRTRCDASLLEGSKVWLLGTATIGTDHIDLSWCESHGIKVASAPGCNAPAVMQYVASTLHEAGFDPHHHTLGVIGKGHIGTLVTDLYRRAGGRVLVCDPPRAKSGFTDEEYLSLEEVLEKCDAITLHVPYTKDGPDSTHHLLGRQLPETLRIVVNASRGGVVEPSLIDSRRKFIIDTWPFEGTPEAWPIAEREALIAKAFIATPHIAGYSIEGKERATAAMLAALGIPISPSQMPPKANQRSLAAVISSFDPIPLSAALKASPTDFEALRASHLRPE